MDYGGLIPRGYSGWIMVVWFVRWLATPGRKMVHVFHFFYCSRQFCFVFCYLNFIELFPYLIKYTQISFFIIVFYWVAIGRRNFFFIVPALLLSILTPLFLPSSPGSLSYFILAIAGLECLGKHTSWVPISYCHTEWYLLISNNATTCAQETFLTKYPCRLMTTPFNLLLLIIIVDVYINIKPSRAVLYVYIHDKENIFNLEYMLCSVIKPYAPSRLLYSLSAYFPFNPILTFPGHSVLLAHLVIFGIPNPIGHGASFQWGLVSGVWWGCMRWTGVLWGCMRLQLDH